MNYNHLMASFWEENYRVPFGKVEMKMYLFIVYQCQLQGWRNPVAISTSKMEHSLQISRKSIAEARERLRERALIDFKVGQRNATALYIVYQLSDQESSSCKRSISPAACQLNSEYQMDNQIINEAIPERNSEIISEVNATVTPEKKRGIRVTADPEKKRGKGITADTEEKSGIGVAADPEKKRGKGITADTEEKSGISVAADPKMKGEITEGDNSNEKENTKVNEKVHTEINTEINTKIDITLPPSSSPAPLTTPPYNPPLRGEGEEKEKEIKSLKHFDSLLQEVLDGKCRIWEQSVCKKFSIESVQPYLASFRDHVIANSRLSEVGTLNDFKGYFTRSFRYFSVSTPIQQLMQYKDSAKDERFKIYCQWVYDKCFNVSLNLMPLREEEFIKLRNHLGPQRLMQTVIAINERREMIKKYYSLYRLIFKWINYERK